MRYLQVSIKTMTTEILSTALFISLFRFICFSPHSYMICVLF